VQGTVDTLFTLDEAIANYELLRDAGVPVSMLWYCGGHGVCLTEEGDRNRVTAAAIAWLDRYVADDTSVDTGPAFELIDQHGTAMSADGFDVGSGGALRGTGSGTLALEAEGGSGPAIVDPSKGLLGTFIGQITPAPATNSVDVAVTAGDTESVAVGPPEVTLTYHGTPGDGTRPARVFAQLVDPAAGLVIGNQITPIEVVLDGGQHTTTVALEAIAHTVAARSSITLQLVASTVAYIQPQFGGTITFDRIDVSVPVSADLTVVG
jgi:ABC-2 type transport system ATP-binding protein